MKKYLIYALSALVIVACNNNTKQPSTVPAYNPPSPIIGYSIIDTLNHDINAFTEGLLVDNSQLIESTGSPEYLINTKSVIGIVNQEKRQLDVKVELDRNIYFGEGITIFGDRLYQVTYKNQKGFIYNKNTFKKIGEFAYRNAEGWGMTSDSLHLIMSDGSHKLTYFDPFNLSEIKVLEVTEHGNAVPNLNELEYINGYIYANIWMTNTIVKIDPNTGEVKGKIDCYLLAQDALKNNSNAAEMNGIAWDKAADKIYVTGKMWPFIYEISFPH